VSTTDALENYIGSVANHLKASGYPVPDWHANSDDPNDGAIHLKGDREDGEVETWLGWTEESGWYRGTDRDGTGLNGIRWAWISVLATPDEVLAWLRRIESSVAAIWEMDRPRYRNFDDNDDFGAQLAKAGEDQPESWSGTQAETEGWKDQHEADTLVPQLQRPQVCTATHPEFGRCFIDADDHTAPGGQDYHESEEGSWPFEGRPSDSERLAPRSEVDYSIRIKTECCATEGMTGIDCRLPKGHADWHSGRYDCRTDGTESVGYPVCIQWPRNEWDRCEPEQDAAQAARSEATPKGALSAPTILCGHIHDGAECPDPRVPGANGCWAHYGPGTEDWLDEHGTDAPAADAADGSS
jgi:hypothetical protein